LAHQICEVSMDVKCKTDPRAPHGFNRNASHAEDRYVCDCEFWVTPEEFYRPVVLKWAYLNGCWSPSNDQCDALLKELGII